MIPDPTFRFVRDRIPHRIPESVSISGQAIDRRDIYLPPSHAKALRPDAQVVRGMRGTGKSFWWSVLRDPTARAVIPRQSRELAWLDRTRVTIGFGEDPQGDHPRRDTLRHLLGLPEATPRLVWRTIIVRALVRDDPHAPSMGETWPEHVLWVQDHPAETERIFAQADRRLVEEDRYWLILFDALDQSADDWPTMNAIVRGLLRALLDLRPYRRLRGKCFLRTDQLEERDVADFPDASKLMTEAAELDWTPRDLHALLFHRLGNDDDSRFRDETRRRGSGNWERFDGADGASWIVPRALRVDESVQKSIFHAISGPWMGRDHRRGFPYSWLPRHLADAWGRTSPRSYLAALRHAAIDTAERHPKHPWALHYDSIRRGVQAAARIRGRELREDYPWVDRLLGALSGLVVPCPMDLIARRWREEGVLDTLRRRSADGSERLPPAHLEDGPPGLRRDLESLGVFLRTRDGRVNVPDVYRMAYGLGRKGSMPPESRPGGPHGRR